MAVHLPKYNSSDRIQVDIGGTSQDGGPTRFAEDRFGSEKPKLPQGKPAGFFVPRSLSGGDQREVSNIFFLIFIQPESWGTAIAAMVGARDIDFTEDPAFSLAFQLLGPDEDSVRQFMNETRRKAFMAHPTMRLEVDGDCLLIMKPHFRLDAENVRTYMSEALPATQIMIGPTKSSMP